MLSNTSTKPDSKAELIRQIRTKTQQFAQGDERAFAWLYNRYQRDIYNLILRKGIRPEIASDLLQEAFIGAWRYHARYDITKATFHTWLTTIARNVTCLYLKKEKPNLFTPLEVEGTDYLIIDRQHHSYQPSIEPLDLRPLLSRLNPDHSRLIELVYYNGYSCSDAGRSMGLPEFTALSRHRAALKQLRKVVTRAEYDSV